MAKKRANGEGSIRKRKDGRWEGRYTAGRDPDTGKPRRMTLLLFFDGGSRYPRDFLLLLGYGAKAPHPASRRRWIGGWPGGSPIAKDMIISKRSLDTAINLMGSRGLFLINNGGFISLSPCPHSVQDRL